VLAGERVDRVVAMLTGLPRAAVAALVAGGGVRLGGQVVATRSRRVAEGDVLVVAVPDAAAEAAPAPDPAVDVVVVHADPEVVVVDKPAGLVVHPGHGNQRGTLVHGLLARFPDVQGVGDPRRPGIVHRLDKGTSGLLAVARTPTAYASLVGQLAARTVERRYLALVWGEVVGEAGLVDAPLARGDRDPTRMAVSAEGRTARTRYRVLRRLSSPVPATLLECRLETGRTHQVRVHLASIGHPVCGDGRYGGTRSVPSGAGHLPRPFLHAAALAFDHPATAGRVAFASPLPPDLETVLDGFS